MVDARTDNCGAAEGAGTADRRARIVEREPRVEVLELLRGNRHARPRAQECGNRVRGHPEVLLCDCPGGVDTRRRGRAGDVDVRRLAACRRRGYEGGGGLPRIVRLMGGVSRGEADHGEDDRADDETDPAPVRR